MKNNRRQMSFKAKQCHLLQRLGIILTFVVILMSCGGRRAAIMELAGIQTQIADDIKLPEGCELRTRIDDMKSNAGSVTDSVAVGIAISVADSLYTKKEYGRLARYVSEAMPLVSRITEKDKATQAKVFEFKAYLYGAYLYLGMNDRGIKGMLGDITVAGQMQLNETLALYFNNLATLYKNVGMNDEAIKLCKRSLKLNEELNDSNFMAINYNKLASIYFNKKDYPKAIEYSFLALHFIPQADTLLRMNVQLNISTRYTYINEYGMARKQLEPVMDFFKRAGIVPDLTYTYARYAFIMWKTGNNAEAERYFGLAFSTIGSCDKNIQQKIAREYAEFCKATGDREKELAAIKRCLEITEGINVESSANIETSVSDFRKYEMEQAERTEQLMKDNRRKFYIWTSILAAIALAALGLALITAIQRRRRTRELTAELMTMREQLHRDSLDATTNNELISKLSHELQDFQRVMRTETKADQIKKLRKITSLAMRGDKKDNTAINAANADFFKRLVEKYPSLTPNDLRLAAMLRQGMSSKDIAELMVKEVRSIETARNRLRKKIGIPSETDLCRFFMEI